MRTRHETKTAGGRRSINWWKWVTLVLIGLLLGSGVWFVTKVVTPVTDRVTTPAGPTGEPAFTVSLTKRQLNRIITYYLNDYQKNSQIKYTLTVADQAKLGGSFKFFNQTVDFSLLFDPLVKSNGDIELKATKLNIGQLPVPISYVLSYVGHSYKLPNWVKLNSKQETIVLELSKFKLANGMRAKATKIDLASDEIDLSVFLPSSK
ncbi:YpmS family protein [Lacticaseibacillus nasuensis]|uniref:YpmS family protein n=1 Tax=Lacticaseibacillus nasuensis TaxID=944671 RepID=UPI0006D1168F|nr:YpmS family protein [Lacticaseibacillus nasuensis]